MAGGRCARAARFCLLPGSPSLSSLIHQLGDESSATRTEPRQLGGATLNDCARALFVIIGKPPKGRPCHDPAVSEYAVRVPGPARDPDPIPVPVVCRVYLRRLRRHRRLPNQEVKGTI